MNLRARTYSLMQKLQQEKVSTMAKYVLLEKVREILILIVYMSFVCWEEYKVDIFPVPVKHFFQDAKYMGSNFSNYIDTYKETLFNKEHSIMVKRTV